MDALGPVPESRSNTFTPLIPSILIIDTENENNVNNTGSNNNNSFDPGSNHNNNNNNGTIYRGYVSGNSQVIVEVRNVNAATPSQLIINELDNFPIPSGPEIVSSVFDIFIVDSNGNEVEFNGEAEICFNMTSNRDISIKRSCLAYFNEITQEWECEDECLKKNNDEQFCGTTTHFTAFSVLFYGLDGPGSDCSSAPNPYIFDEYWQDLILTASFIGAGICCFCLAAVCSRFYFFKRLVLGKEGHRINNLRIVDHEKPSVL